MKLVRTTLAALAVSAAIAPAAQAASTWEGVWNTDFGQLTMSAGGSGSYVGPTSGTISGPAVGNVNEGTWSQAGDPPKSGKYRFELGGQSFTGTWSYDTGGCGVACGWNGVCAAGACLKNGVGGGGGDDDDGKCKAPSGGSRLLAATRDDLCPGDVKFSFRTDDGLPDKPRENDLPDSLRTIEASGSGTLSSLDQESPLGFDSYEGKGEILLTTTYASASDKRKIEGEIGLAIAGPAGYAKREGGKRRVEFGGYVSSSTDDLCDYDNEDSENFAGELAVDGQFRLRLEFFPDSCLSSKPFVWKSKSIKSASIKAAKR